MIELRVETNIGQLLAFLEDVREDQLPFALSLALNRTATLARDEVRAQLPRRFTIRKAGVVRGFRVKPSAKRQWPRLEAQVGTVDAFWTLQETGGTKRAQGGGNLAIPTGLVRRTKRGLISKAQRPRALIAAGRARKAEDTIRATPKRGPVGPASILYLLRRSAQIDPALGLRETVAEVVERELGPEFRRAMGEAIASARKRALARKGGRR